MISFEIPGNCARVMATFGGGFRAWLYMSSRYVKAIAVCFTLAACATPPAPEPITKTVFVDRAVPVSCVPSDRPARPDFADTAAVLKAAPDFAVRDQLVKSEWARHWSYEALQDELLDACAKAAPPPMPK